MSSSRAHAGCPAIVSAGACAALHSMLTLASYCPHFPALAAGQDCAQQAGQRPHRGGPGGAPQILLCRLVSFRACQTCVLGSRQNGMHAAIYAGAAARNNRPDPVLQFGTPCSPPSSVSHGMTHTLNFPSSLPTATCTPATKVTKRWLKRWQAHSCGLSGRQQ